MLVRALVPVPRVGVEVVFRVAQFFLPAPITPAGLVLCSKNHPRWHGRLQNRHGYGQTLHGESFPSDFDACLAVTGIICVANYPDTSKPKTRPCCVHGIRAAALIQFPPIQTVRARSIRDAGCDSQTQAVAAPSARVGNEFKARTCLVSMNSTLRS